MDDDLGKLRLWSGEIDTYTASPAQGGRKSDSRTSRLARCLADRSVGGHLVRRFHSLLELSASRAATGDGVRRRTFENTCPFAVMKKL